MSDETIVAVYDTPAHANLAAADLRQAGVPERAIIVHTGTVVADGGPAPAQAARAPDFWSTLFGGSPDHDVSVYDRSIDGGGSVLSVLTPESYVSRVLDIIESHQPIDIDERAMTYGVIDTGDGAPRLAAGTQRLQDRGTSRIRRFVSGRSDG